jgi:hypothetical protein
MNLGEFLIYRLINDKWEPPASIPNESEATGSPTFIQGTYHANQDAPGTFEALVSKGEVIMHYWRDNYDPTTP